MGGKCESYYPKKMIYIQYMHSMYLLCSSGVIRTHELLDHETAPHYWLTVYATDGGVVPLSSFVEVYIEVQDVNDNAPQTSEPVYYPSVMENSAKDVSIIQIEAFDPDTRSREKLSFKITSGNPQGFFSINPKTGEHVQALYFHLTDLCKDAWKGDRSRSSERHSLCTVINLFFFERQIQKCKFSLPQFNQNNMFNICFILAQSPFTQRCFLIWKNISKLHTESEISHNSGEK